MSKIIFIIIVSTALHSISQTLQETAATVEKLKEIRAKCIENPFHQVLVPAQKETELDDYLKIKQRCTSGNLNQVLYGVKNQNRLEKLQIGAVKKMNGAKKVQAVKERIDFISGSLKENLNVAEVYIHLLWLREYASIAKRSKNNELLEHLRPVVREIRENQKKIFTAMLMHDSDLLINEFASVIYDDKYGADEKDKAKKAMNMHWKLKNEFSNSVECLSMQKCFICVDKIQNTECDIKTNEYKKLKSGAETDYTAALIRYAEAPAALEKLITRLEKAVK